MSFTDLLADVAIETNARIRHVAANLGLSASQAYHLLVIPFNGIAMSALAKKLGLDASTLTRNIHNLEKHNFVMRRADKKDKRIQLIYLTDTGSNAVISIENELEDQNYTILNLMDLDEQELLLASLEKLSWAMVCQKN